jgi:hypothetical protein
MAERNRPHHSAGQPDGRSPSDRGYDETVRNGPPLDVEVAQGDSRQGDYWVGGAGVRGYGEAGASERWGSDRYERNVWNAQGTPRSGPYETDEPFTNPPPDFGANRAWGREGGWNQGGTGTLRGRGPKGYKRSDDRILEDLCEHLMDIVEIDSGEVTITVRDGCVTLDGSVPVRSMRYDIENIAAETLGVTDVENNLSVPRRQSE